MILEIEKLLDARLSVILKESNSSQFLLGFKECLGLLKIAIRKDVTYNLHVRNRELEYKAAHALQLEKKLEYYKRRGENKEKFRSNFAIDILALIDKGDIETATRHLRSAIIETPCEDQ